MNWNSILRNIYLMWKGKETERKKFQKNNKINKVDRERERTKMKNKNNIIL